MFSPRCVEHCKSDALIQCAQPVTLDMTVVSALEAAYSRALINNCVTPCQCDAQVYAYPGDMFCEVVQSFAIKGNTDECTGVWSKNLNKWNVEEPADFARKEVLDYLVKRETKSDVQALGGGLVARNAEGTTQNPWENWCKKQCAKGMGGSACYCDIIP